MGSPTTERRGFDPAESEDIWKGQEIAADLEERKTDLRTQIEALQNRISNSLNSTDDSERKNELVMLSQSLTHSFQQLDRANARQLEDIEVTIKEVKEKL